MRKIVNNIFLIMMFFICSMLLTSCKAITAQNITSNTMNSGMNSSQGTNGNPGMNGGTRGNQNSMRGMMNADLMGKIISVDGSSIKIELIEQTQNNKSSNSRNAQQDVKSNQNNGSNNTQSQKGFNASTSEMNYTGVEKILTINDDVNISQGSNMARQNNSDTSKPAIKVSDLKEGQIIMIWYKENTETVERISVVQS